ncbi:MAG: hypothetical protein P3W90_005235, partial [Paracoccus sp. (in: a-proteobacteria)]|nr:hypothetical protein [Paracoccus sp. (in: a-proteobacteria)]
MGTKMQRVKSLDYLKLLMAVGVVIGHSGLLQEWDTPTAFLIGNGFLRMIVPMFAVMSGFLFHGSMERGRVVPWMTQILVFYIGGMLVYAPFWFGAAGGLSGLPGMMLWGYFHLWYLSGLLLAAVMIVGLRFVGAGVHVMAGLAAVLVLAGVCVQVLLLDGRISVALHYFRNGLTVIFPFMMFGFLWAGLRRPAPPLRRLMPLILLAVALMVIENQLVLSLYGMSVMHEIPASSLLLAPLGFLAVLGL